MMMDDVDDVDDVDDAYIHSDPHATSSENFRICFTLGDVRLADRSLVFT